MKLRGGVLAAQTFKKSELVCLEGEDGKRWFVKLDGKKFSTHEGNVNLDEFVGKEPGTKILTNLGRSITAYRPSFEEILLHYIRRTTQIIYPKDLGYIILKLGIREGFRILEAGTGSGAATLILAHYAGPEGKVFTYEKRQEFSKKAESLIASFGLSERVVFKISDVTGGFDETDIDAFLLDLKEPEKCIGAAFSCLNAGGTFAVVVPTTNQVSSVIRALEILPAADVEICEVLLRKYKVNAERLRPNDTMVGHTAYLITGRKLLL